MTKRRHVACGMWLVVYLVVGADPCVRPAGTWCVVTVTGCPVARGLWPPPPVGEANTSPWLVACGLWIVVRSKQDVCGLQSASGKRFPPLGGGLGGSFGKRPVVCNLWTVACGAFYLVVGADLCVRPKCAGKQASSSTNCRAKVLTAGAAQRFFDARIPPSASPENLD